MGIDNTVTITGNVSSDGAETRFTPAGHAVANFSLAVNRRWQNKQSSEWEEQVSFIDVTAWQQLAENVAETLTKGMRVTVVGRFEQRTWTDSDTGGNRSKIEVVADDVSVSMKWATVTVTRNEKKDALSGGKPAGKPSGAPPARHQNEEPF